MKQIRTQFLKAAKTKRTVRNGASRRLLFKFEVALPINLTLEGLTSQEIDALPKSFPFEGTWGERAAWFLRNPSYAGHWGDLDASYYIGTVLSVFSDGTVLVSDSYRGEYLLDGGSLVYNLDKPSAFAAQLRQEMTNSDIIHDVI